MSACRSRVRMPSSGMGAREAALLHDDTRAERRRTQRDRGYKIMNFIMYIMFCNHAGGGVERQACVGPIREHEQLCDVNRVT
jgi:hypothetical protein